MEENKYLDITCKIMNAAMKGESLDLSAYDNDPEFLRIMKEQTFLPFLYEVDKRKIWRKYYYQAYLINEKFDAIGKKIKDIFDANNIDHIFLKGFELRKLYPKPWLRQMGDIDVLVRKEDYKKAATILIENGYKKNEIAEHDIGFNINGLNVELHHKLLGQKESLSDYFNNPFNEIISEDKNTKYLNPEYNTKYIIAHYIKHLKLGAGFREIIDIYLLFRKYNFNYSSFMNFISAQDQTYLTYVFKAIFYIFEEKQNDSKINEFLIYLLDCGIHGFGHNTNKTINRYKNSKDNKFIFILKNVFIPIPTLFRKYPWTKSIILIPFGYIYRIIYLTFKHSKNIKAFMASKK